MLNISAKTEYACIAVLELALHYGNGQPVQVRKIAEAQGVPSRFLVQILLQLKGAGLVGSTRGASGGYQLLKDPARISLGEVMTIIEGRGGELVSNSTQETATTRVLFNAWREVAAAERQMLYETTFADLADRLRGQSEPMYYI